MLRIRRIISTKNHQIGEEFDLKSINFTQTKCIATLLNGEELIYDMPEYFFYNWEFVDKKYYLSDDLI
jgi:hypothetical protein